MEGGLCSQGLSMGAISELSNAYVQQCTANFAVERSLGVCHMPGAPAALTQNLDP